MAEVKADSVSQLTKGQTSERSGEDDERRSNVIDNGEQPKSTESVIDYAKNTMNNLLSMYGYDERVTTETLKSNIKSEPISPSKEGQKFRSKLIEATMNENMEGDLSRVRSKTATVTPLRPVRALATPPKMLTEGSSAITQEVSAMKNIPGIPRKPITPYMRYRNMIFEEIKHRYPGCSPYDLACLISSKWSMLTDSERKVWEQQYEEDLKEYNENLRKFYANPTLKRDWMQEKKTPEPQSPANSKAANQDEPKYSSRTGLCNWCKGWTPLQDFSSVLEGREIYCTGLCSEKCFTEAAQQIRNVEGSSNRPRYIKSASSMSQPREEQPFPTQVSIQSRLSSIPSTPSLGFNWEQYLSDTNTTVAPWTYFKHARNPPPNNFSIGMKLESRNNKMVRGVYSLATITAIRGARIQLDFDGTDSGSDFWKLSDSGDIQPVSFYDSIRIMPPLGFKYDSSQYHGFYVSSLQNADVASARLFKKEPSSPLENYFSIGMKLEAVVKKTPHIVGVASVVIVDGDQIKVEFDGFKGIGYWCSYYDRDIFPAGWCARTGHPLQSPGGKSEYLQPFRSSATPPLGCTSSGPRSGSGSPFPSTSVFQRDTTWKEKPASPNNVEVFINGDCYCGPYIETRKLLRLPCVYRGNIVTVLKNVLENTIKCAADPKTVFGFLKPGRGNCVITAICDGITYQCCLNNIDRVSKFWTVLEQFSDNLRCCPNLFSSTEILNSCGRCSSQNSVGPCKKKTSHSYGYSIDHTFEQSKLENETLKQQRQDSSIILCSRDSRLDSEKEDVNVDECDEPPPKKKKVENFAGGIQVLTAPKSWSIDDVVLFVQQTDLKDYIEKFKENEIDGKALLLLQRDLILSHMGFKLGPAVKLLDLIAELHAAQEKFS